MFVGTRENLIQWQNLIDGSGFDRLRGHSENYRRRFVLSYDHAAGGTNDLSATRCIVSHTRENNAHCHGSSPFSRRLHSYISARPISRNTWTVLQNNAARRGNPEMMRTGADIKGALAQRFICLRFLDFDFGHVGELY